jgi:hypothetical protein
LSQKVKDVGEIISWIGSQAVISYTPEGGTEPGLDLTYHTGILPMTTFLIVTYALGKCSISLTVNARIEIYF